MSGAKEDISALNSYLFQQLESLTEEGISQEEVDRRVKLAKAVCDVSDVIIAEGTLALKAEALKENSISADFNMPKLLR